MKEHLVVRCVTCTRALGHECNWDMDYEPPKCADEFHHHELVVELR